jgi:hypothetical protein
MFSFLLRTMLSHLRGIEASKLDPDPALQNMKFLNFFLLLWAIFALLDPDPIRIRIQIRNTDKQLYFSQHIVLYALQYFRFSLYISYEDKILSSSVQLILQTISASFDAPLPHGVFHFTGSRLKFTILCAVK